MKELTLDQIKAMDLVHGEKRLAVLEERSVWNAVDIIKEDRIHVNDRMWIVLREEFIPADILHKFGLYCAERALERKPDIDKLFSATLAYKRLWLEGHTPGHILEDIRCHIKKIIVSDAEMVIYYATCTEIKDMEIYDAWRTATGGLTWCEMGKSPAVQNEIRARKRDGMFNRTDDDGNPIEAKTPITDAVFSEIYVTEAAETTKTLIELLNEST